MDIDLLWSPGGWIYNTSNIILMAKAEDHHQYSILATLLFLVLLLLVLVAPVLFARPCAELSKTSVAAASSSSAAGARRVLLSAQQSSSSSVEFDQPNKQAAAAKNLTKQPFKAAAHEVPSGPNPDSNK